MREECVCTPQRADLLINRIMARVAPTTLDQMMQQVATDLVAPQRDQIYELVSRKAQAAIEATRQIDDRTNATIEQMERYVRYEDALEDEAYTRNTLFDSVQRGYLRSA